VAVGLAAAGLIGLGIYAWPQWYLHTARAALERHDYAAARTSLLHYLEARPNSAEAHLLLAQLDRRANRFEDAARHLDACQRLGGPAEAIELERALGAVQNGVFNAELDRLCFTHLSRQDSREYFILEALSEGFIKTYRLKEALGCLERMLVLQPDSAFALRRRAWIYAQAEQLDRAEADYRQAVEIDPGDTAARLGLAQILLDYRKNGREAAEHFEYLWTVQPDAAVAVGLARSWRLLGRGEDARRLLDDWLKAHPNDANALAERGELAMEEQALDEAVTLLQRAVALAPYHRDGNYTLYVCLSRLGRTAQAEACQKRLREAKEAREQIALLTRRLQGAPNDADLRCQIAQLFLRYGAEEEGVRWLLTTLANQPHHRPSHLALADYYEKHGQVARAAEHRRLASNSG
jgi:tetratricopeptide (TPR) repeat protein